jgi:hypothetical protein
MFHQHKLTVLPLGVLFFQVKVRSLIPNALQVIAKNVWMT